MSIESKYKIWKEKASADPDVVQELREMDGNAAKIEDAFYRELAFGTGGLRGVIGAGTNRMNIYTVAKASQGLANYIIKSKHGKTPAIAVSYDSRRKSDLFAKTAASVFAANGIHVYIYSALMPTPCLSFAVRKLACDAGIMVTASHNPAKYNGYKVYGADGCQITTEAAEAILAEITKCDPFDDVKSANFEAELSRGSIEYINDSVLDAFIDQVRAQSVVGNEPIDRSVSIVYTPLNGTGRVPVLRALRESGFANINVVPEQEFPDGDFPTCPYPNPEIREAMALGMKCAQANGADLLLATDPDCDRCSIAVKNKNGEFVLLTGNETGMLLLDFICQRRSETGTMPANPVMVKTIVTIDMAERIAAHYGVKTVNVLTGFKFIGEHIGRLEAQNAADSYIFGFEESYGYLSGTYVRDKDAVNAAHLICEMFAYYATQHVSLLDKLNSLYKTYGYCLNTLHSFEFEGSAGFDKMQAIMRDFRTSRSAFGPKSIVKVLDYSEGLDGLPKSDVIKYILEDNCSIVVRPSGTEPKLKTYISVSAADVESASKLEQILLDDLKHTIC